jgi:hypothetical protein
MSTICVKCNTSFSTPQSLKRHLSRTTPCDQPKEHLCRCGRSYSRADTLSRHRKRCDGQRTAKSTKKLTLEDAQQIATLKGGRCLSTAYIDVRTDMEWECSAAHRWKATLNSIKNMDTWCLKCSPTAPLTIEIAQQTAQEKGGRCLSDTYVNTYSPLKWECDKNTDHVWVASLNCVKDKGSWCPYCRYKNESFVRELLEQATERSFPETKGLFPYNPLWRIDGYCAELGVGFEYHGKQHYEIQPFFHTSQESFERQQFRDRYIEENATEGREPFYLLVFPYTMSPRAIAETIEREIGWLF